MMIIAVVTFIICMIIVLSLAFYPIHAWLKSVFMRKEVKRSETFIQPVSVIIAAHNEEECIRQKLDSFLDADEWIEGSEIIVVLNGSTDATLEILAEYDQIKSVKIIVVKEQSSKILSVNRGVKAARHDLLVFSDCRQKMKKGSVRNLVHNFNDPDVGTVNSTLTDAGREGKLSFRSLLTQISHWESLSGSSLNVFGALYAQRKSVFRKFPEDILFDDLFVVVSTLLQKKRLITERNAVIYDVPFSDYYKSDRIRRLARGLLLFLFSHFAMIRRLPLNDFFRFIIFKYLKLILPFVLIFLFFDVVYLCWHFIPLNAKLMCLIALVLMLSIKSLRNFIIHFLQINYYFLVATLQFIFLNKRSNQWGKLKI